jgi:hypothetical protein
MSPTRPRCLLGVLATVCASTVGQAQDPGATYLRDRGAMMGSCASAWAGTPL